MSTISAIGIVLDPSEVATDRTELDINAGAIRIAAAGPDWGDAEIAASISDRKFGSVPVGYRIPNRMVTIPLIVRAVSGTTFNQAQTKLQQKVARFQDEGGWLKRTSSNGTTELFADIIDATLTFPDPQFQNIEGGVVLTLECLPDFYGNEAAGLTTTASSGDNDSLIFTEADIPGDYPARSRYTFVDTGSQARQAVLIASQSVTYDSASTAALTYEAEALTPLDDAAVVSVSGAHGGTAVVHSSISPSWTGVLSTEHDTYGHLTHHGSYRVFARVWSYLYESRFRLEYAVGDAATRRVNASVSVPGDSEFYIVDLGEVRLDEPAVGTHQWLGAIFAQSDTAGAGVGVDKLWLAPTESLTICKARQLSTVNSASLPLSTDYRDSFSQAGTINLNGGTADRGGTWTTSGGTVDFYVDSTTGRATRTQVSDGTARIGLLGGTITASYASVDMVSSVYTQDLYQGLVLRYVDASNYLTIIHYYNLGYSNLDILQSVGGTTTILSETRVQEIAAGGMNTLRAAVDTAGRVEASFVGTTVSVVCPAAKTGGALDDGKAGIIDFHPSATATTRQWDNFVATEIDVDTACLSGGVLSASHNGAWRETEDSGIYTPVHVEGILPRAPASGLEARTCRTLILPSAGDFDTLPDSDPLAFSIASAHRPTYLFAPEE